MKKTKDEVLMAAIGVDSYSRLHKFQRVQLYYAMDEWAANVLAQLQQHGVMQAEASASAEEAAVGQRSGGKSVSAGNCDHEFILVRHAYRCKKCN